MREPRRLESTDFSVAARSRRSIPRGVGIPGVVVRLWRRRIGAIATCAIAWGGPVQAELVVKRLRAYAEHARGLLLRAAMLHRMQDVPLLDLGERLPEIAING